MHSKFLSTMYGYIELLRKAEDYNEICAVCRSALENAASVASMVLTTESLVADIPEKNPPVPAAPDMGGMY